MLNFYRLHICQRKGVTYYKLHKVAPAIYNYEKALVLSPNDNEIKINLEFARKMAVDDIKVIPKVGFNKLLADFTSKYHYDTWAWIAVVFAFLFLLFFVGYYLSQKTILKRVFFIGMFFWLLGIFLSSASGQSSATMEPRGHMAQIRATRRLQN